MAKNSRPVLAQGAGCSGRQSRMSEFTIEGQEARRKFCAVLRSYTKRRPQSDTLHISVQRTSSKMLGSQYFLEQECCLFLSHRKEKDSRNNWQRWSQVRPYNFNTQPSIPKETMSAACEHLTGMVRRKRADQGTGTHLQDGVAGQHQSKGMVERAIQTVRRH